MRLAIPLLLLAPLRALAADPCTVIITARAGDTCATISSAAGISVSQFLRANPSVASCASLVTGTRYCVDPGFNAAPPSSSSSSSTAPAATPGSGTLTVSTDGQCGPPTSFTCLASLYGDCCSEHGWCGGTADHCTPPGCQAGFGRCDGGNATTTVYVTRTTTVTNTVPLPGVGGTGVVTQIVRSTTTVSVPAQTTATVRVTDRTLVMLTSTVTTIKTVTITDAKMCRTTTSRAAGQVVTRVEGGGGGGAVVLTPRGDVGGCRTFYKVGVEDSCEGIVRRHREGGLDMGRL
ncbi:carbohydrate-binding module family 18 protein [Podospora conica]|nr:carbohydrate-binding module family 18 protein [Schizothecium conicum]